MNRSVARGGCLRVYSLGSPVCLLFEFRELAKHWTGVVLKWDFRTDSFWPSVTVTKGPAAGPCSLADSRSVTNAPAQRAAKSVRTNVEQVRTARTGRAVGRGKEPRRAAQWNYGSAGRFQRLKIGAEWDSEYPGLSLTTNGTKCECGDSFYLKWKALISLWKVEIRWENDSKQIRKCKNLNSYFIN